MKNKIIITVIVLIIIIAIVLFSMYGFNKSNNTELNTSLIEESLIQNTTIEDTTDDTTQQNNQDKKGDNSSWPNTDLLNKMIDETIDKFIQLEYINNENGITIPYNLYIPENYDSSKQYPLVLFIHDASVVGDDVTATLTQGFGAIVWATDEWQAKNECFVLAPQFSETIANDDYVLSESGYEIINLLNEILDEYSIDENRLYITGQSMGCMTAIELNITYPDLFAASFYVAGQWDTERMRELADDKMFFIVSEGDTKASPGMDSFIEILEEENAEYAFATWNAQWSEKS